MELENTTEIGRPAAEVYRFVATEHARNHPRWDPGIIDFTQVGEGPVAKGTEFTFARKMMGGRKPMKLQVTDLEPDRSMSFRVSGPMTMDMRMIVEPAGEQSSRLTFKGGGQISGPMRLMTPMIRSQMSKEIAKAQQRIKEMVEAGA